MADPTPAPQEKSLVDKAKDAFNSAKDSWNSHEEALIGSIKGVMGLDAASKARRDFVDGGKAVMPEADRQSGAKSEVDRAVDSTPGNSADY